MRQTPLDESEGRRERSQGQELWGETDVISRLSACPTADANNNVIRISTVIDDGLKVI